MNIWFNLPHLTGLTINGSDARSFCHAQFSSDFNNLPERHWQVTSWCNGKGRCLVIILACCNEDGVDLVFPASQLDLISKLAIYAIGRQVSFSTPAQVQGNFAPNPSADCLLQGTDRALRLTSVPGSTVETATRAWQVADLCLPLPWLSPASSGRFLPQSLDLEANGGLSYGKGCFPGQEIIARVHYLGRRTERLLGVELDARPDTDPDQPLIVLTREAKKAGELLHTVATNQGLIGLSVSPVDIQPDTVVVTASDNPTISGRMTTVERLCYYRENIGQTPINNPESWS